MAITFGGAGVFPNFGPLTTNVVTLQAGQAYTVPSGRWAIQRGKYTTFQQYDIVEQRWTPIGAGETSAGLWSIFSDGNNYRLVNQTGCAVGALLTTAGSGYTSAPTVTASAGSSIWRAIVGGAISATVTVSNGGSNYTYPPMVLISPPPGGGIQASAHCTLSGGAVSTITVDNQGAGYTSPPTVVFVNDPREGINAVALGSGAVAITSLTGSGTVTGLICIDHGLPATYSASAALPTLSFTGGGGSSAAATIIMCLSITAYALSATTAGSGYSAPVIISAYGGFPATAAAYTNPWTQSLLVSGRAASIVASVAAGGALTTTGQTVNDGGVYPGFPTVYVQSAGVSGAGPVQAVFLSPTMGGVTDTSYIMGT